MNNCFFCRAEKESEGAYKCFWHSNRKGMNKIVYVDSLKWNGLQLEKEMAFLISAIERNDSKQIGEYADKIQYLLMRVQEIIHNIEKRGETI